MLISLNTVWVFLMEDYSRQWRNCEHRITVYLFISLLLLYWIVINLQHRHLSDQVEIGSFVGFNTSTLELFRNWRFIALTSIESSLHLNTPTKLKTKQCRKRCVLQCSEEIKLMNWMLSAESLISVYYLAQKLTVHSVILQIDRNSYF